MFDNLFWILLFLIFGAAVILFASSHSIAKKDDTIDDISESNIEVEYVDDFPDDITNVPGHEYLYYSTSTRIVYKVYVNEDIEFLDIFTSNGHLCKYLNGKIMEVVDDGKLLIVHPASLPN